METLKLDQPDVDSLFKSIGDNLGDIPDKAHAITGLRKILSGEVPQNNEIQILEKVFGTDKVNEIREHLPKVDVKRSLLSDLANIPRSIQASFDLSFPFRQGLGLIHTKAWWTSWYD